MVYTGVGALTWLPDLAAWARSVAALLRPGGLFYVRDGHPVLYAIDYGRAAQELVLAQPYFPGGGPRRFEDGTTYADPDVRLENATATACAGPARTRLTCASRRAGSRLRTTGRARRRTEQAGRSAYPASRSINRTVWVTEAQAGAQAADWAGVNIALIVTAAVFGEFGLAVLVGRFLRPGSARPTFHCAPTVAEPGHLLD